MIPAQSSFGNMKLEQGKCESGETFHKKCNFLISHMPGDFQCEVKLGHL